MARQKNPLLRRACVVGALASMALLAGCEGAEGPQGPAGPQGLQGDNGAPGQNGQNGQDGRDGTDGTDGTDGSDGSDGADGNDGTDGVPGKDGSARTLQFDDVGFPWTNAEKHNPRASAGVTVNGEKHAIGYDVILRSGKDPKVATDVTTAALECDLESSPESCFGVIMDTHYQPLRDGNGQPVIASSNDFSSLLQVEGNVYAVNAFESNPAGLFVTKVKQDATGDLEAEWTKAIDLASVDGVWTSCAGSVTPWGTHLASEEYPPDARPIEQAMVDYATYSTHSAKGSIDPVAKFKGLHPLSAANFADFKADYSPYMHGYNVEVTLDAAGNPTIQKHYAMGRVAIELAYVMPDQKTAYITDDGGNVGLFMFVADRAGDLSSGRLYAARLYQTTQPGGELHADVQWIDMGHATNAEIRGYIHPQSGAPLAFSDIFDYAQPTGDSCADGFRPVRANSSSIQCLKLRDGMAMAASRLETRR